jgi:hypothetical protein
LTLRWTHSVGCFAPEDINKERPGPSRDAVSCGPTRPPFVNQRANFQPRLFNDLRPPTGPLNLPPPMAEKQSRFDAIVIGAGIAGCAIAAAFSRQGRRVLLIERSLKEPDRIVGELLQPGGVDALRGLGLADCLEGIDATPIEGYHLYWQDDEASFWFCDIDGRKPEGRSFHHGKFVSKLRDAVCYIPGVSLVEGTVTELLRDEDSSRVLGVVAVCSTGDDQMEMASFSNHSSSSCF